MKQLLPSSDDLDAIAEEQRIALATSSRRIACRRCGCESFKVVCPDAWPVSTVAVVCQKCGTTAGYFDEFASRQLLRTEEIREKREFVVSHRTARKTHGDPDVLEQLILMGLEGGLSVADAAVTAEVGLQYAHAIAVKFGYARKVS